MANIINFYSKNGDYGEFSNFFTSQIIIEGKTWKTVEHYFQAQKFMDPKVKKKIKEAPNPMEAAQLGRSRHFKLRSDWESIKVGVMKKAVLAKFTQHQRLRDLLLSTGSAILVERTENDSYWGDGGNGKGKNMLGKILMQVRKELKEGA